MTPRLPVEVVRKKRRSPPPAPARVTPAVPMPPAPDHALYDRARLVLTQAGMLQARNGQEFVEGVPGAATLGDLVRAANRLLRAEGKPALRGSPP